MGTVLWTIFAVATMVGVFTACTVAVVVVVRALEHALARHRAKRGDVPAR